MRFVALILVALAVAAYADEVSIFDGPKPFVTQESAGQDIRDKLLEHLFKDYKAYSYAENTTVDFGVSLLNVAFDESQDVMNSGIWLRYKWTDKRLSWQKTEYDISVLRVPPSLLWMPDITLYNGADKKMDCEPTNALIYSTGEVLWVPPCRVRSFCNITLSKAPYEEQVCTLKFGSWTFDGYTMGLDFFQKQQKVDLDNFVSTRRFKVTKNEAVKESKTYECCVEPYYDLLFTLGFQRHPEGFHTCTKE